jgi:hemolysin activation/secretion protein
MWERPLGARLGAAVAFAFKHNTWRADSSGVADARQTIYDGTLGVMIPAWRSLHVAVDGRVDWLQSDEAAVPLSEQFYIGGARTVRGYRENQFHGRRIAYARNELRLGRSSRDGFYAFVDAGYVRQEPRNRRHHRVRRACGYGFGVRSVAAAGRFELRGGDDSPGQMRPAERTLIACRC